MSNKEVGIRVNVSATGTEQLGAVEKGLGNAAQASEELARAATDGSAGLRKLIDGSEDAKTKLGDLDRATDGVGESVKTAARGFDQLDTAAKDLSTHADQTAENLGDLGRAAGDVGRATQEGARGFDQLDKAARELTGEAGQAAAKLGALGRTATDTRGQAAQLATALEDVKARVDQAGSSVDALGRDLDGAFRTLGIRAASDVRAEIDKLQTAMARIRAANPFSEDTQRAATALKERVAQLDAELGRLPAQTAGAAAGVRTVGEASGNASDRMEQATRRALSLGAALLGISSAGQVARSVLDTASAYETLQVRLEQTLGSAKGANEQFEKIKRLAIETPFEVSALTDTYIRLSNFGLKPSMQQMQALADTAAIAGGGTEALSRVTMALGQAWAKTRLQGDEILQLTEAGVPVWDLLAKATGKNVTELQNLSQAGALGRDVILQLFDAIGEKNAGASVRLMNTFAGTVSNAKDALAQFFDMIGKAGVLEYLTKKLQEALAEFDRMKDTGELERKAKAISDAFIDIAKGVESAVKVLKELAPLLELALAAWAGNKAVTIAKDMWGIATAVGVAGSASAVAAPQVATLGAASTVAATGVGVLAGALRGLLRVVGIGLVVEAVTLLISRWLDSKRAAQEAEEAAKKFGKSASEALAAKPDGTPIEGRLQKTRDQVRDVAAELDEFRKKLPQLESDLSGLTGEGLANAAKTAIENIRAIKAPAAEARQAITTIAERAAEVLGVELPSQSVKLSSAFKGVQAEFQTLVGQLPNLGLTAQQQAAVVSQALATMIDKATTKKDIDAVNEVIRTLGATGKISATQVAEGLALATARATKLRDAIDDATPGIDSLREATRRVNGDFEQLTTGLSTGFKKSMVDLQGFADQLVRSGVSAERASPQIAAALDHQIRTAKTREEIEAAAQATEKFRAAGLLLNTDYSSAVDSIKKKLNELNPVLKQVAEDANTLNVKLASLSDKPKKSVEEMLVAYERLKGSGKATADEVREAFVNLAREAIKANGGIVPVWVALEAQMRGVQVVGGEVGKKSVEWSVQMAGSAGVVTEAVQRSTDAYREMGSAATAAGRQAVAASEEAARAEARRKTIVDSMFGDPAALAARNSMVQGTIEGNWTRDAQGRLQSKSTPIPTGQLTPPTNDGMWEISTTASNRVTGQNNVSANWGGYYWTRTPAGVAKDDADAAAKQAAARDAAEKKSRDDAAASKAAYEAAVANSRAFYEAQAAARNPGSGGIAPSGPSPAPAPLNQALQPITIQIGNQRVTGKFPPGASGPLEELLRQLFDDRARTTGPPGI